jgi:hypothetical protein
VLNAALRVPSVDYAAVIAGGGPAGIAAAITLSRAGRRAFQPPEPGLNPIQAPPLLSASTSLRESGFRHGDVLIVAPRHGGRGFGRLDKGSYGPGRVGGRRCGPARTRRHLRGEFTMPAELKAAFERSCPDPIGEHESGLLRNRQLYAGNGACFTRCEFLRRGVVGICGRGYR